MFLSWQRAWQVSMTRRCALWYRDCWVEQPTRHMAVVLLTALIVYAVGRSGQPEAWRHWWLSIVFGGVGGLGLLNHDRWESIRRSSRVLQWWDRQRMNDIQH